MGVRTIREFLSQKNIPSGFDRRRLLRIAAGLIFTIAVLGVAQWATAFQGDLLWLGMVAFCFLLVCAVLLMLPGRPLTTKEFAQFEDQKKPSDEDWIEELHRNDPHIIGSPSYRDD